MHHNDYQLDISTSWIGLEEIKNQNRIKKGVGWDYFFCRKVEAGWKSVGFVVFLL